MERASLHPQETLRQETLDAYDILDTQLDAKFQVLVEQARAVAGVAIGLVSLVDRDRQWFKARAGLDAKETPRELAFCAHAILGDEPFVVPDAREDDRFHDNPLVTGEPHVTFYAGVPLHARNGMPLGTLCVIDTQPRELQEAQKASLTTLAHQVEVLLELRKRLHDGGSSNTTPPPAPPTSIPNASSLSPELRLRTVTDSIVWRALPDTVERALGDFAQSSFRRLSSPPNSGGHSWSTASIVQLDANVGVTLTIDVSIEDALLTELAHVVFGEDVGDPEASAVLLEATNVVMGATKISFESLDHVMTAGIPRRKHGFAEASAADDGTHAQSHVFADANHRIIVRIAAAADASRLVRGSDAKSGMVILEAVVSAGGEPLAICGERLTSSKAEIIARDLPARELRIAGADLG